MISSSRKTVALSAIINIIFTRMALLGLPSGVAAFGLPLLMQQQQQQQQLRHLSLFSTTTTFCYRTTTRLCDTNDPKIEVHLPADDDDDDDDDDFIEPGMMRVSEIKAELQLRNVDFQDCFDKESLVQRLQGARATGKADPKILEKFNKQKLEETFSGKKVEIKETDIESAVAQDGTLPGGLTPDQFKKLTGNPEIMTMLQSTKMQEAMTLMMTGGRDQLEEKLKEDPELRETIEKLDSIMKSLM